MEKAIQGNPAERGKYELVVIVDAQLPQEEKDALIKSVTDVVAKEGGKVINSGVWLDKQKFTFPIKKRAEGTYYLINFEAGKDAITKMNAALRLNEKLLRFAIMSAETQPAAETAQA